MCKFNVAQHYVAWLTLMCQWSSLRVRPSYDQAPTHHSSLLNPSCLHILWPLSHIKVGRGATTAGTSLSTTRHSDRENLGFLGLVQAHVNKAFKKILRAFE